MIDDEDLEMSDEAIWRAAAEADEDDDWLTLCGELQVVIDESPDRAAAVVQVARHVRSLAGADGLDPWDPQRFDRWMLSNEACTASGCWAAMLVLALWKGTAASAFSGRDLVESLSAADKRALLRLGATPMVPLAPDRGGDVVLGKTEDERQVEI